MAVHRNSAGPYIDIQQRLLLLRPDYLDIAAQRRSEVHKSADSDLRQESDEDRDCVFSFDLQQYLLVNITRVLETVCALFQGLQNIPWCYALELCLMPLFSKSSSAAARVSGCSFQPSEISR